LQLTFKNKKTVAFQTRERPLPFLISSICLTKLTGKSEEAKPAAVCSILCEKNWWGKYECRPEM